MEHIDGESKAKKDAIEAWNTWRGRYFEVGPDTFCESNPCNGCALVVDPKGDYAPLKAAEIIGGAELLPNGSFTTFWPKLAPLQATAAKFCLNRDDALEYVSSLTARWCALFSSVIEYRSTICELLRENDPENRILNKQLEKWNEYLKPHGFTPFSDNDLRGINLSGLRLDGENYSGINLRHVDLSFSECSVSQLRGANLYEAIMRGVNSIYLNLSFAIVHGVDLSYSFLSHAHFEGADLGNCTLRNAMCHSSSFEGASLRYADFSHAQCTEIVLNPLVFEKNNIRKEKQTDIEGLIYEKCIFKGACTVNIDWTKNPAMKSEIERQNTTFQLGAKKSYWQRFFQSLELKPGLWGISLDLKRLLKKRSD
jgi:uncharacterized protein YjbI with pentapeptide repeats